MAEAAGLPALGRHKNIQALLAAVEIRMLDSLGPASAFVVAGQASARGAAEYHLLSGGRRVRACMALSGGVALGLSEADCICIASSVELLHQASLVHDDLQDQDVSRRGQDAVWFRYGGNLAICTGDLLLSAAYATLCGISQPLLLPSLLSLLHERTSLAIDGQCADIAALGRRADGLAAYVGIATAKSGALLSLPLELVFMAAGRADALVFARLACQSLAVSYQILDDLDDMESVISSADDSTTTAMSFNIIQVIQNSTDSSTSAIPADAVDSAIALALSHLELSVSKARQLPGDTAELLLALTADLRGLLNAHYAQEAC